MLLKFILSNYRSFKDSSTLDLEACSIKEHAENVSFSKLGIQSVGVLKSIALLGANTSGKSNLFKGFGVMRHMIINSAKETVLTKTYNIEPFRLSTETEHKPTRFECSMVIDNIIYRYGFTCNNIEIISEWLFMTKKKREETIFIRTKNEYEIVKYFLPHFKNKLMMLTELTRNDALYLSVLTQFNIDMATHISNWFAKNTVYTDPNIEDAINYTAQLLADPVYSSLFNEIIQKSDLGFNGVEKQTDKLDRHFNSLGIGGNPPPKIKLKANHIKYDSKNKAVDEVFLELNEDESSGAQKLVALLGPMIKILLEGGTFWIDDFDAKIHPYIVTMIMDLFNSDKYNQKGAQLIGICYNQQILRKLRRDQIVFINKNAYGASSISALYVYKPQVRSNAFFDKEYLQGLYGGIPRIDDSLSFDLEQIKTEADVGLLKNGHSRQN